MATLQVYILIPQYMTSSDLSCSHIIFPRLPSSVFHCFANNNQQQSTTTNITCTKHKAQSTMPSPRRQVCLFGTSANPPTGDGGHTGIVKALSKLDSFHEIRILPVFRHTFASKRKQLESFHHRYNMCKLSFGSIDKAAVSDAERKSFERMAKSLSEEEQQNLRVGTANLLEMFLEEEENTDFTFCLGGDTFLDLTALKWKRSRDVLQLLEGRLVVFARKGSNIDLKEHVRRVNETEGMNAVLLEIPTLTDVSSSSVRSCKDEETLKQLLSGGVLEYIKENRLFSFANEFPGN